jgi:hypothetical protein
MFKEYIGLLIVLDAGQWVTLVTVWENGRFSASLFPSLNLNYT